MVVEPSGSGQLRAQRPATRYAALDSLPGIVALAVAVHHLQARAGIATWEFFGAASQFVDFFFVLSGFVIATSYGERLAQGYPPRSFMWLRWWRIWPMHWVIIVVYVAIECTLALTGQSYGGRMPFTGTRDPWALVPTLLLVQAFVMAGVGTWNTQSWSISVELRLYWVWALAWRTIGRLAIPLEAAMLVGLVLVVEPTTPHFASDLLFAAMVLVFALRRGLFAGALCTAPFVFLGTISYSLYMVHGFVIGRTLDALTLVQRWTRLSLVEHPAGSMGMLVTPAWASSLLALAIVATAVTLAWMTWRWIEDPVRLWSRSLAASPARAATT